MNRSPNMRMGGFSGAGLIPPVVKGLLIANVIMFFLQEVLGSQALIQLLGLTPSAFWRGALWQPISYLFLHGSLSHLFFNMLALWMFGGVLESVWGTRGFLKYYFLTGIGAGLSNCLLMPGMGQPIIGASGAIYGLLAAYGILFPNTTVFISFLIPIKAKYLVVIFGLFEFFASISNSGNGIAHLVHLGGMVIGIAYLKRLELIRWAAHALKNHQRHKSEDFELREHKDEEHLRQEIDKLLDKINDVGIGNLTDAERKRLRTYSDRLKRNKEQNL